MVLMRLDIHKGMGYYGKVSDVLHSIKYLNYSVRVNNPVRLNYSVYKRSQEQATSKEGVGSKADLTFRHECSNFDKSN